MTSIQFPAFSGLRCLMMPFIQGDPDSLPDEFAPYAELIDSLWLEPGRRGHLTIDELPIVEGQVHRGARAKHGRALHTEAGIRDGKPAWGGGGYWGGSINVFLYRCTRILLASNLASSTAVWDAVHENTTEDGDIGHLAGQYPYASAKLLGAGEVANIGIFTPHECLPAPVGCNRQFIRILGLGVCGREPYFTENPKLKGRWA